MISKLIPTERIIDHLKMGLSIRSIQGRCTGKSTGNILSAIGKCLEQQCNVTLVSETHKQACFNFNRARHLIHEVLQLKHIVVIHSDNKITFRNQVMRTPQELLEDVVKYV